MRKHQASLLEISLTVIGIVARKDQHAAIALTDAHGEVSQPVVRDHAGHADHAGPGLETIVDTDVQIEIARGRRAGVCARRQGDAGENELAEDRAGRQDRQDAVVTAIAVAQGERSYGQRTKATT